MVLPAMAGSPRETALPEGVAEHGESGAAGLIFLRPEGAADHGLDAEQRKQSGGDALGLKLLRIEVTVGAAGEAEPRILHGRHLFRGMALLLPSQEIDRRNGHTIAILRGVFLPNHKQTLRVAEGQRLEQHRIHNAENGSDGTHPERQCEQGDGGEHRGLPQQASPVTQIPPRIPHRRSG